MLHSCVVQKKLAMLDVCAAFLQPKEGMCIILPLLGVRTQLFHTSRFAWDILATPSMRDVCLCDTLSSCTTSLLTSAR